MLLAALPTASKTQECVAESQYLIPVFNSVFTLGLCGLRACRRFMLTLVQLVKHVCGPCDMLAGRIFYCKQPST